MSLVANGLLSQEFKGEELFVDKKKNIVTKNNLPSSSFASGCDFENFDKIVCLRGEFKKDCEEVLSSSCSSLTDCEMAEMDYMRRNVSVGVANESTLSAARVERICEVIANTCTKMRKYSQDGPPPEEDYFYFDQDKLDEEKEETCVLLCEIPKWDVYYVDQRFAIPCFRDEQILHDWNPDLNRKVSLCFEDVSITQLKVDIIVNSTTEHLDGNHGVSKQVLEDGGPELQNALDKLPFCEKGEVIPTKGYALPCTYVLHANGPSGCDSEHILRQCYDASYKFMLEKNLRSIAFPCISTGKKGFSPMTAARVALSSCREFLEIHSSKVERIVFSLRNARSVEIYRRLMQVYFPVSK